MMTSLKWFLAIILAVIAVMIIWFLGHIGWIVFEGLNDETYKAHVAVVKGIELKAGKLSETVKTRLDKAFDVYNERQVQRILVSGGNNFDGYNEAVKMGQYLVKRGVPKEMIFVDQLGDSLFQTAAQTQRLLSPYDNLRSIVIMGSWYDILRSKQAYQHCGFLAVYGQHNHHFEWSDLWRVLPSEVISYYPGIFKKCPAPIAY